jgi:hypothetical protein
MESNISSVDSSNTNRQDRLRSDSSRLTKIEDLLDKNWDSFYPLIISELEAKVFVLKITEKTSKDKIVLVTLFYDKNVWLAGIYARNIKDKLIGYCVTYTGAPVIKWFPAYLSIIYSKDISRRDPEVTYNDVNIRTLKFDDDFLLVCRKHVPEHTTDKLPDAAVYLQFKGIWKDGT